MKTVGAYLERLKKHGTSIAIEWGEDDDVWQVTWITGGVRRYIARDTDLEQALGDVWVMAAVKRGQEHQL